MTNLNNKEINAVSGGSQEIMGMLLRKLEQQLDDGSRYRTIDNLIHCVNVIHKKHSFTLCTPRRKPLDCHYELWGMLHNLDEELPKC